MDPGWLSQEEKEDQTDYLILMREKNTLTTKFWFRYMIPFMQCRPKRRISFEKLLFYYISATSSIHFLDKVDV